MKVMTVSAANWLYPDDEIIREKSYIRLDTARGGMAAFQILTDANEDECAFSACWTNIQGVKAEIYQLLGVCCDRNSGRKNFTSPYEEVKDFVTKKAPFSLYDAIRSIDNGMLQKGRKAFYVYLEADRDALPGNKQIVLQFSVGNETAKIDISLNVHTAEMPLLKNAAFGMVNWLSLPQMEAQHGVKEGDERFDKILTAYIDNEIAMRNTHLQLPSGVPVRDENGRVIDFDFSLSEKVGNLALERGFLYIMGGFVARFHVWNEPEIYLLWEKDVTVASHEGYRQLKIYFSKAYEVMKKNGWEGKYMQTLVDEPQFANSDMYRILSSITRKFLPGIKIHDPVEATTLDGALEIWDVKQAIYEKYIDEFRELQRLGEEMWLYTCGFPAGKMMNRVLDLPLTASLLPMWLCYLYDCTGFLHWGYNYHTEKPFEITSYRPYPDNPERSYPAGNAHIVYPGENRPMWSVRAYLQKQGAEDFEILNLLGKKDPELAKALVRKVTTDFDNYTANGEEADAVRREILEALDR